MKEIICKRLSLTLRGDWTQPEKLAIIFREEQIPESTPFSCYYNQQDDTTNLIFIISSSAPICGIHTF